MGIEEHAAECQEALEKLVDKKVLDIKFKPYNHNCWRLYINTDKGKLVMTFCEDWTCPVVEYRDPKLE
jgi:hypothetical protein